ncbi:MAG TPA: glycoside hydrolase family 57 protein [Gemmatimonadaceae bacterium]|nr:glycoside hydrolase family 57 protein [Gemmatimonadaceae bacterium]
MMHLWHGTADAPRTPARVSASDWITLDVGSWPIAPGQTVWVDVGVERAAGGSAQWRVPASWRHNAGDSSYWRAEIAPLATGDVLRYRIRGHDADGDVDGPTGELHVGPTLYLALLWHQHQPLYRDPSLPSPRGSYAEPWVRRHAIRDYYPMAALVAAHPTLRLTINLTPVLLWQLEDYVERGATDRALELTRTPAEALNQHERDELRRTFFDARYETEIAPHPRYAELWALARRGAAFGVAELRDLQMWANLAWFAKEFREADVALPTGEVATVRHLVARGRDFTPADVDAMLAEQYKIMRAVIPMHRLLQERGQIEVATSPYFHPILPLLVDTDQATLDRPGATLPPRFAHPEDADAQVRLAVADYVRWFGRAPRGMWPAEGAVGRAVVPILARHGVRWIASDRGVLARSGEYGYRADEPDVLCRPYRAREGDATISVFFREPWLSDTIGFHYQHYADYGEAAREFLAQIKQRYARQLHGAGDRVLTVALDGENAWSAYREDARPFLHALYGLLEADPEVATVTFSGYLDGIRERGLAAHPSSTQPDVHPLFTGSWVDEPGSAPGVDLGTWIGEPEENEAWALLGQARDRLASSGATPESAPEAYRAIYAAEGSDWFWWLGTDQESGRDRRLDALFRAHLAQVYRALGDEPPAALSTRAGPPLVIWTATAPPTTLPPGGQLLVRAECPGRVVYTVDGGAALSAALVPVRRADAGVAQYQRLLGPFAPGVREVCLRIRPAAPSGAEIGTGGGSREYRLVITDPAT